MKEERRKKGELGQEALMRKLKNMKVNYEDNVDMLVKHFGFISRPDLYFAISQDEINLSTDLKVFNVEGHNLKLPEVVVSDEVAQQEDPKNKKAEAKKANRLAKAKILVNGEPADTYGYNYATCCNPVEGDNIFAYLTTASGLKIHRTSCKNATHLLANYGYRVIKAEWVGDKKNNFVVDLVVTGVDSGIGVIRKISDIISSQLGINIRSFSIAGEEGYFEGNIGIVVINTDQLNVAIKALTEIEGISNVVRKEKK
jgi:GTP pyrophosphokinase